MMIDTIVPEPRSAIEAAEGEPEMDRPRPLIQGANNG